MTMLSYDQLLSVVVFLLGVIMGLLAWFFKSKIKASDEHGSVCMEKHAHHVTVLTALDLRMENLESHAHHVTQQTTWLGDCVVSIGAALNAPLPPRPANGRVN